MLGQLDLDMVRGADYTPKLEVDLIRLKNLKFDSNLIDGFFIFLYFSFSNVRT